LSGRLSSARRGYTDPGREKDDFYRTPPEATQALIRVERTNIPLKV